MTVEQLMAALKAQGLTAHKKLDRTWLFEDRDGQIVALPNPANVDFDNRAAEYARWIDPKF